MQNKMLVVKYHGMVVGRKVGIPERHANEIIAEVRSRLDKIKS